MARATLLVFLGVFALGVGLFSRRNHFPFYYHPDEPRKVKQLIQNKRNLHHPLLMLTSVDLVRRTVLWGEAKRDPQRVAEIGRWVTAAFAALAAAALAALASQIHGVFAGCVVGALCVVNPLLFELAHYFKEDPYLAAGIALTCLALHQMRTREDARSFALLGAATALAAAGKYVGFALLPMVVGAAFWHRSSSLPLKHRLGWLLGTFAVVWLSVNWWVLRSPGLLWESVAEETTKAFGGEEGPTRSIPHLQYLMVQHSYSTPWLEFGAGVWLLLVMLRRLKVSLAEWVLFATAVLLFAVLSFTPKTSPRYHLPVALAFSYFAGVGVIGVAGLVAPKSPGLKTSVAAALAICLLIPEMDRLRLRFNGFARDDRAALVDFVKTNVPANATIAQDEAANLPEPTRRTEHAKREPLPQKIIGEKQIADRGELSALKAEGVTHVAICARTYVRFLSGGDSPERRFYEDVRKRGTLLFSREPGPISYLQPGLSLIDIMHLK